jgi:hypothetical protein
MQNGQLISKRYGTRPGGMFKSRLGDPYKPERIDVEVDNFNRYP